MKIYIAAKFSERQYFREMLPSLWGAGIIVTSSWITSDEADFHELGDNDLYLIGSRDIEEIEAADALVLDTRSELSRGAGGGREFEVGYALGKGKTCFRVGPSRNPFHFLMNTNKFHSWEEFVTWRQKKA